MSTPSILQKIVSKKEITLQEQKQKISLEKMIELAFAAENRASFKQALKKDGLSIIGEIKKASPSKGIIKDDFDPVKIAMQYEGNVDALSILTEEHFFMGRADFIMKVQNETTLPILRKDFIIDEYQIYEAKYLGASSVLLICAILSQKKIEEFIKTAASLNLDALVEVHDKAEAKTALDAGAEIIGINNRDLHTFKVDLMTTINTSKAIDSAKVLVSESGINTKEDIRLLKSVGINAVLVGESFMRSKDISKKAEELKSGYKG